MINYDNGAPVWEPHKGRLPSLANADVIAIDTETKDDGIQDRGSPGGVTNSGFLLGVSVAVDGWSAYIPIAHPDNKSPQKALHRIQNWLNRELSRTGQPKIGANILYDLEWLRASGCSFSGPFYDVQYAEALLDETRGRYNLDSLSKQYLPKDLHKLGTNQKQLAEDYLGEQLKNDVRAHLWRLPSKLVGAYAEQDAITTLAVWKKQEPLLRSEDLWSVFELESSLIPLLLDMRFRGVRVDMKQAKKVEAELREQMETANQRLAKLAGNSINVNSTKQLKKLFDKTGTEYPTTEKGNASFKKGWLQEQSDRGNTLASSILDVRRCGTLLSLCIEGAVYGHTQNGRIHCQFHPLRSDNYGTVSGRFSSSNPNLQQVPAVNEESGSLIRRLFLPEVGGRWWKIDYSQIEYRMIVHYAVKTNLEKANAAATRYKEEKDTDFHAWVAEMTGRPRRIAKGINFGLAYGMGLGKLCETLGLDYAAGKSLMNTYHLAVPFVRKLSWNCSRSAAKRGYIRTILGRKRRFNMWEPMDSRDVFLPREEALEKYGDRIKRAGTHKAMNALIQGSAADLLKQAMINCYDSGVFSELGPPCLTVHDELDGTLPKGKPAKEALLELRRIMESAISLEVPLNAELSVGKNWWDVAPVKE